MTVNDAGRAASADAPPLPQRAARSQQNSSSCSPPRASGSSIPTTRSRSPPRRSGPLYRDLVLVRRIDTEAIALQRQGELGIWASLLGQEAAQVGSGRALAPRDMAFPTYREHGVAWCRGVDPVKLLELFRGRQPRRLGPEGAQLPPVHDRDRQPDAARHRLRHGHPARRGRGRGRRGGHRLLRRRRHQPGRRQRGLHLGRGHQRAGRVLLPEQPVGDLRAAGAAEPGAAVPARARLRLPRRPGRRQRRARLPGRDPQGAGGGPGRPGPDADRGLHLPDGRAHHLRRPDPLPAGGRAGDLEAQGPDRAGQGST